MVRSPERTKSLSVWSLFPGHPYKWDLALTARLNKEMIIKGNNCAAGHDGALWLTGCSPVARSGRLACTWQMSWLGTWMSAARQRKSAGTCRGSRNCSVSHRMRVCFRTRAGLSRSLLPSHPTPLLPLTDWMTGFKGAAHKLLVIFPSVAPVRHSDWKHFVKVQNTSYNLKYSDKMRFHVIPACIRKRFKPYFPNLLCFY